jgi:hypothetical protein
MKHYHEYGPDLKQVMDKVRQPTFPSPSGGGGGGITLDTLHETLVLYLNSLCKDEDVTLPLTMIERDARMKNGSMCGVFFPTAMMEKIETQIHAKRTTGTFTLLFDLTNPDEYEHYQEFVGHVTSYMDKGKNVHPWMIEMAQHTRVMRYPFDSTFIEERYARPSVNGTKLHAYIEHRLRGRTREECAVAYPLAEKEDAVQVEAFLASLSTPGRGDGKGGHHFRYLEHRVGSFRHKICGSIDAIWVCPVTGIWTIYDWKRAYLIFERGREILRDIYAPGIGRRSRYVSAKFCISSIAQQGKEKEETYEVIYTNVTRTDEIYKYMIQLAVYRLLCILNGATVSTEAYLVVFHPLHHTFRKMRVDLTKPCKGIGSPIEVVNWIFHQRETHLLEYFYADR